eukprot:gene16968-733_t
MRRVANVMNVNMWGQRFLSQLAGGERAAAVSKLRIQGWAEVDGRDAIQKTYNFKNFTEAIAIQVAMINTECARCDLAMSEGVKAGGITMKSSGSLRSALANLPKAKIAAPAKKRKAVPKPAQAWPAPAKQSKDQQKKTTNANVSEDPRPKPKPKTVFKADVGQFPEIGTKPDPTHRAAIKSQSSMAAMSASDWETEYTSAGEDFPKPKKKKKGAAIALDPSGK